MYLWHHVFLLGEAEEMAFNGNWEQVYRVFAGFPNLKTYSLGLQVHEQAEHIFEHLLNTCECMWTPMSEWEQPLNTHWVCMNAIECVWHPLSLRCSVCKNMMTRKETENMDTYQLIILYRHKMQHSLLGIANPRQLTPQRNFEWGFLRLNHGLLQTRHFPWIKIKIPDHCKPKTTVVRPYTRV